MRSLTEIAPGVLVATSSYALTTSTVVVGSAGGCLVIDPAVTVADLAALAAELLGDLGLRPAVGWSTHPHWDHVLWSRGAWGRAQVRRARRSDHRRDRAGRHHRRRREIGSGS